MIPIHWGTYFPIHLGLKGKPEVRRYAAARVRQVAMKEAAPDVELRVLRPGEGFEL